MEPMMEEDFFDNRYERSMLRNYYNDIREEALSGLTELEKVAIYECVYSYTELYRDTHPDSQLDDESVKILMKVDRLEALSKLDYFETIALFKDFNEFCIAHDNYKRECYAETLYD